MAALNDGAGRVHARSVLGLWAARSGFALDLWICGSLAWLALLARELDAGQPEPGKLFAHALFVITLACEYSALACVPLLALRGLRSALVKRTRHADAWIAALLALALSPPSFEQADLLSSGGLLLESQYAPYVRALLFLSLLGANSLLWQAHLLLSRAPGHGPARLLERLTVRVRRWPPALRVLLWFAPGAALEYACAVLLDRGLRAYLFLGQFMLPSVWLFGCSLLLGAHLRLTRSRAGVVRGIGGGLLVAGLWTTVFTAQQVRRARAEFERRGGLVALTELAVSSQHGAPYANLDMSKPDRFHCPPVPPARPESVVPTAPLDRRNVILISVDTLRKDALTMQLDGKPVAPALRSFAAHSLSFERAVTTYPATLFALSSALTGWSPSEVLFAPKPPSNVFTQTRRSFQEQLIVLPSVSWFRRLPVPQLISQSAATSFLPNAEAQTSWLIQRLRDARLRQHRTFAWIHYYEPHTSSVSGTGSEARRSARRSYANLVRSVDVQIGRLLAELERLGYLRDSLLVLFADHGEALGELDYFGHHVYLNRFATDVPLMVHAPGLAPRRSERLVMLSDIAPTILQWLGDPLPDTEAQSLFSGDDADRVGLSEAFPVRGRALYDLARVPITSSSLLNERMQLIRTAAIDYQPKVSLVSARYRLIVNRVTGTEELYDRVADPDELHDLSEEGLPVQRTMQAQLGALERTISERIYCRVRASASRQP